MSKVSRQRDLRAVRNLITQAQEILSSERTREAKIQRSIQLLDTAVNLTDSLIAYSADVERQENRLNGIRAGANDAELSAEFRKNTNARTVKWGLK